MIGKGKIFGFYVWEFVNFRFVDDLLLVGFTNGEILVSWYLIKIVRGGRGILQSGKILRLTQVSTRK